MTDNDQDAKEALRQNCQPRTWDSMFLHSAVIPDSPSVLVSLILLTFSLIFLQLVSVG